MSRFALLLLLLSAAYPSGAEPFGLAPGMGKAEVEGVTGPLQEVSPSVYLATKVPGGYPELETYSLYITAAQGLCRIQATSEVIPSDGQGRPLRERFDRLMERLWEAYGYPEVVDRLSEGSTWKGRDEWMISLYERDRVFMSLWTESQGSELPPGLDRVVLSVRALKPEEGFLNLDYTLSNWPQCRESFDDRPKVKV